MDRPAAWRALAIDLEAERPFRIGRATVDPISRDAIYAGERERLQPQTLKVLIALSRHRGEVVTRSELVDSCWDGRIVGEDVINRSISLLRDFGARAGGFGIETVPRTGYRLVETNRRVDGVAVGLALAAGLVIGALFFVTGRIHDSGGRRTTVVISAARGGDQNLSAEAAQDVAVELGRYVTGPRSSLTIAYRKSGPSDFSAEIGMVRTRQQVRGELTLFSPNAELLWSAVLSASSGNAGGMSKQAAAELGVALACLVEARAGDRQLGKAGLKLYLRGCSSMSDRQDDSPEEAAAIFQQLTRTAPAFAHGWANLALVESAHFYLVPPAKRDEVRRHILESVKRARGLDPSLAATYVAETNLLPYDQHYWANADRLLAQGLQMNPDSPVLHRARFVFLQDVGRMNEAVDEARRAFELDPLSPAIRESYIAALTYAGLIEPARRELASAEAIWSDSESIRQARYRIDLRYGDAATALRMLREEGSGDALPVPHDRAWEYYIRARISRSPATQTAAIGSFIERYRKDQNDISGLIQAWGEFGRVDEAYAVLATDDGVRSLFPVTSVLFRPWMRPILSDSRFFSVARRLGLVDFWRSTSAWPDFCKDPQLPYDCRTGQH